MLRSFRNFISAAMLRGAHRVATDDGWARLADSMGAPSMRAALLSLRDRGIAPQFAIDGGACVGDWCRLFRSVFPDSNVLMVEPQQEHAARLTDICNRSGGKVAFVSTLLGPPGVDALDFTVLKDGAGGTGSSVFPERSDVLRAVERRAVATLDSVVANHRFGLPDLLKLDVQGFELEVLKGSEVVLASQPLVLLEVSLLEYNAGAPLVHEVIAWLAERDFRVGEVYDLSRRNQVTVQLDLLFAPPRFRSALHVSP